MPAVPSVSFGVIVEINHKPVPLMADAEALEKIKENGLDLNLPGPVDLGRIDNDLDKFGEIVSGFVPNAPALPSMSSLPKAIQDMIKAISKLDVRVDDLRIHIPASDGKDEFRYALRIAAEWDTKDAKKLGPITLKGLAFGVESPAGGADAPPVKSK